MSRQEDIKAIIEAYLPERVGTVMALCSVESDFGANERRLSSVTLWSDDEEFPLAQRACEDARIVDEEADRERWEFDIPAQYCGILQMGKMAGIDVGFRKRGFRGWNTCDHLLGNYEKAVQAFGNYMNRYESRHQWDPFWMALCWKGGPGFVKNAREHGIEASEQKYGFGVEEYLERFMDRLEKLGPEEAACLS